MVHRRRLVLLLIVMTGVTAGCASTLTGPSVLALPGSGKNAEQFRAADSQCRQVAASELQTAPEGTVSDQRRYDMVYVQCMYAEGHQVQVPGRGWRSRTSDAPTARPPGVPPPPPGTPPAPPSGPVR
jgi:hypothetical protein